MTQSIASELQKRWAALKLSTLDQSQPLEDQVISLQDLLATTKQAGKHTFEAADRANLQWISREIADTIFRLTREYPSPFILPTEKASGKPPPADIPRVETTSGAVTSIPNLPPHYSARPEYLNTLKRAIRRRDTARPGITGRGVVGIQGMGGIGKTVLAAALARDPDIQEAYAEGILWVVVGKQPDLLELQVELAAAAGEPERTFSSVHQGKRELGQLFEERRILLVLDDVWEAEHAAKLDVVGPQGILLVTTRNAAVLVGLGAEQYQLSVLSFKEALALLAAWSGQEVGDLPETAAQVVRSCGHLPLALAMIGAMVRLQKITWRNALLRLEKADLSKLRGSFPDYPYPNLMRALEVSVSALELSEQQRYLELAVFPDHETIPESAIAVLWSVAGLDEADASELIGTLAAQSLLTRDSFGRLSLHDLQGVYLRAQTKDLRALHQVLIDSYAALCPEGWASGPDDGYYFRRLPYHLAQVGRKQELRALLLDFSWLQNKLRTTSVTALILDYDLLAFNDDLELVKGALCLAAHVLAGDPKQLAGQLLGRIRIPGETPDLDLLLQRARDSGLESRKISLQPRWPTLTLPGGPLVSTLVGHTEPVRSVAILNERHVISASDDRTLRIWDLERGVTLRTLSGHGGWIRAVAVIDRNRVLSASYDGTLRVWELETGDTLREMTSQMGWVNSVAVLDVRRIVSASTDGTLRVWDLETGEILQTLPGHTDRVGAVAALDEKRVLSASYDGTLRVWDLGTGETWQTLVDQSGPLTAVAVIDEQRAVSASAAGTLRLWDLETGKVLQNLTGQAGPVTAVAVLDERRVVFASADGKLRIWDLTSGKTLQTLAGHAGPVHSVAVFSTRRLISASSDETLRLWDLEVSTAIQSLVAETDPVTAVAPIDYRKVVAASGKTLRLWDLESGEILQSLTGHADPVFAIKVLNKRRLILASSEGMLLWDLDTNETSPLLTSVQTGPVSAVEVLDEQRLVLPSPDGTIRMWDLRTGEILHTLEGHKDWVSALAVLDHRRLISASADRTLRLWDVETGKPLQILAGHSSWVRAVAILDERRVISASYDETLRLWDLESRETLQELRGHTGPVSAVAALEEHHVISASLDQTVRIWELESGATEATFTLDAPIMTAAIAERGCLIAGDQSGQLHFLDLIGPTRKPA